MLVFWATSLLLRLYTLGCKSRSLAQLLKVQFDLIDNMIEQLENMPSSLLARPRFLAI